MTDAPAAPDGTGGPVLAVDVGNTNVCLGLLEGREMRASWRIRTDPGQTEDEFTITLAQLLSTSESPVGRIAGAVVASVVPPLTDVVIAGIRKRTPGPLFVVGPGLRTGITIRTATTLDCISPHCEYLGGVIAPGITISAEALFRRAAKLPKVTIGRPRRVLGKNTELSMQSGLFYGYVSLIDGLVDRLAEEMGFTPQVIATGGHAAALADASRTITRVEPDLTLLGLAIIWQRNRG
jgi:type III pantothenate kinase